MAVLKILLLASSVSVYSHMFVIYYMLNNVCFGNVALSYEHGRHAQLMCAIMNYPSENNFLYSDPDYNDTLFSTSDSSSFFSRSSTDSSKIDKKSVNQIRFHHYLTRPTQMVNTQYHRIVPAPKFRVKIVSLYTPYSTSGVFG